MIRIPRRVALLVFLAPFVQAALAGGQLALSELVGMSLLSEEFGAGGERIQDVPVTVTAWFFALASPLTVGILGRGVDTLGRVAIAIVAAPGALAVRPLLDAYTGPELTGSVHSGARVAST